MTSTVVPQRIFNIHKTFPCTKGSLEWKMVLQMNKMFFTLRGSFKNYSLKGYLGNLKRFFNGIAAKAPF